MTNYYDDFLDTNEPDDTDEELMSLAQRYQDRIFAIREELSSRLKYLQVEPTAANAEAVLRLRRELSQAHAEYEDDLAESIRNLGLAGPADF